MEPLKRLPVLMSMIFVSSEDQDIDSPSRERSGYNTIIMFSFSVCGFLNALPKSVTQEIRFIPAYGEDLQI